VRAAIAGSLLLPGGAPVLARERTGLLAQTPLCTERVDATYYDRSLAGEPMANGQPYDPRNPRLASSNRHRLGTVLLLRRADGAAAITVEVMDRGGAELGVDLSEAAFERLAPLREGRIPVCVEVVR
jgi:rare lipoprotein A (peptidoglycan hydrolase)